MRVAAFDLETTDLKAFMGTLLCGSFQEIDSFGGTHPRTYTIQIEPPENPFDPNPDKAIAVAIRDEVEKYNLVLSWNGKMFDVPFLNARLLFHHERPVRPQFHLDLMYYAGYSSNRIGSKRLASVQQFLGIEEQKTGLDWDIWKAASKGDPVALSEVVRHCEIDVRVLAEAYWRLLPYVRNLHKAG